MSGTRTLLDEGIGSLRQRLMEMASEVDAMLGDSLRAVVEQDIARAKQVVQADDRVDQLDLDIERDCLTLIALQQPVARDLRVIGTILKVIADLERIGDYAVDIAKIGRRLAKRGFYKPLVDLPLLFSLSRRMVREAMTAFVQHDLELLRKVIDDDDAVDDLFHQQRDFLVAHLERNPGDAYLATHLLFAAKYLERAADHAVNIAERVHYVETGELAQLAASHQATSE